MGTRWFQRYTDNALLSAHIKHKDEEVRELIQHIRDCYEFLDGQASTLKDVEEALKKAKKPLDDLSDAITEVSDYFTNQETEDA